MKLRAKKGEGTAQREELEEHAHGQIRLTGGTDGPVATALQHGGMEKKPAIKSTRVDFQSSVGGYAAR